MKAMSALLDKSLGLDGETKKINNDKQGASGYGSTLGTGQSPGAPQPRARGNKMFGAGSDPSVANSTPQATATTPGSGRRR